MQRLRQVRGDVHTPRDLSRVDPKVPLQVAPLSEANITDVAPEGPLAGVGTDVVLQVDAVVGLIRTELTVVRDQWRCCVTSVADARPLATASVSYQAMSPGIGTRDKL